jgi:hypothetical protein
MNHDKQFVLEHYPAAYARRQGTKTIICVPKPKDAPGIVRYDFISDVAYTEEWAWNNAANRIRTRATL